MEWAAGAENTQWKGSLLNQKERERKKKNTKKVVKNYFKKGKSFNGGEAKLRVR